MCGIAGTYSISIAGSEGITAVNGRQIDTEDLLHRMVACAIWDENGEKLVLARDEFGIKPLYYFHDGNSFVFASEVRTLLSTGMVPKELCPNGLASYLSYGAVEAPLSIIKGVRMLMP